MVGDDFLVAPVLHRQGQNAHEATRVAYLPRTSSWWLCNLRANGPDCAVALGAKDEFVGGSLVPCNARLDEDEEKFASMTPMFVKFGEQRACTQL